MDNLKSIILAAGEGTRMKSKMPKVLHQILNKSMVDYVIDEAFKCGSEDVCVVIGHKADMVKEAIGNDKVKFAVQKEQLGTGHAVMQAEDFIDENKDIIILYGDTPLITAETIEKLVAFHRNEKNGCTIVSAIVDDPTGYGHIIRNEDGSFKKNVEHKDATDEEIDKAIEDSFLKEFVDSLPNGLDTIVGESGIKLSGGQKQRLAISRALLRKTSIIIFDESTSSLDNLAQEHIKKCIDNLKGKSTIVIVAHRLSTIKNVDNIFFLENGKIVDEGTFDRLCKKNKEFERLFEIENLTNDLEEN